MEPLGIADVPLTSRFDGQVARFLKAFPRLSELQVEKAAVAPSLNEEARQAIQEMGNVPQSLHDLSADLL